VRGELFHVFRNTPFGREVFMASATLARQMGGDAPLMAAMITLQTVLALVTLPLTVVLAQGLLGQ